jgi:hypothetical protein
VARELDVKGRARIAIHRSDVDRDDEGWTVKLDLTNHGQGHARHIEVWLVDLDGNEVSERRSVQDLLANHQGVEIELRVGRTVGSRVVRPVRKWRDDVGDHVDPSAQTIPLA